MSITAYPLSWPLGYTRTSSSDRRSWPAAVTIAQGRDTLLAELERSGATGVVLSTNLPLRRDGLPYSDRREPADAGVAVYFHLRGTHSVLCCDAYTKVAENLRAIAVTVEELRRISKRGVSDFLNRTFTGFKALPEQASPSSGSAWWEVLGVAPTATAEEIKQAYHQAARLGHPDRTGGGHERMTIINQARKAGLASLGL
jgi:hypothetical protein